MGDPKRIRKKYETPMHPWSGENIELERGLKKEYGLKNKREIWKMSSILKKYKDLAKKLIAIRTEQGQKEKKQMMDRLQKLGLVQVGAGLDNVLSLGIKDVMERRLQSLVFRKGLARSMKQARQFIVHQQIMMGDKKITFPSHIVSQEEEGQIRFDPNSPLSKEDHPERVNLNQGIREEAEAIRESIKKKKKGGEQQEGEEGEIKGGKVVAEEKKKREGKEKGRRKEG